MFSAKWQAPRCTPGSQEQLIEGVDGPLIIRDPFGLRVKVPSRAAEMKGHALNVGLAPNALKGFVFPKPFREGRAIVWPMRFGAYEADRAGAIDPTDALEGSIAGHSSAYDQVSVIRHDFLLWILQLEVSWATSPAPLSCDQLPAA